jgi:DNA (cytosine-5)-methyltransferase 1
LGDTNHPGSQGRVQCGERPGECAPRAAGPWDDYEIIGFTDGKQRRIKRGLKPLAHGLPKKLVRCSDPGAPFHEAEARNTRLHGYGNAIVPPLAAAFITAFMETL